MAVRTKPGHKVCSMCGQELPLDMFPTNRGMEDGHFGKCFKCWELFTEPKTRIQLGKERREKKMYDLERAEQRKEQRKEKLRKQALSVAFARQLAKLQNKNTEKSLRETK